MEVRKGEGSATRREAEVVTRAEQGARGRGQAGGRAPEGRADRAARGSRSGQRRAGVGWEGRAESLSFPSEFAGHQLKGLGSKVDPV